MRAITYDKYGGYDLLRLNEIERPAPKKGEVLVRVRAAGLHIGDCFAVKGSPFLMRTTRSVRISFTGRRMCCVVTGMSTWCIRGSGFLEMAKASGIRGISTFPTSFAITSWFLLPLSEGTLF